MAALFAGGVAFLSTAAYRAAATAIGNTESYHAAIIRTLLYQILDTTPAYGKTVAQITTAIVGAHIFQHFLTKDLSSEA